MSHITTCPHCSTRLRVSEPITDKTLICPHCLAEVDNPRPGLQIQAEDINTNVKRDVNVSSIVLAVLIGLCVVGIATAIFRARYHSPGDPLYGLPLFVGSSAALGLLFIIAIIRWMVRSVRRGRHGVHVPIVTGVLGITLIIIAFVFVTIVACVIFFLAACSKMLGH